MAYKEDGNEQFKKRCYKKAITAYSTALKEPFEDPKLTAIIFSNRAAAQYHLGMLSLPPTQQPLGCPYTDCTSMALCGAGNYRSALKDADESRRANPDHMKALIRGLCGHRCRSLVNKTSVM